jgi:hypothetical protein
MGSDLLKNIIRPIVLKLRVKNLLILSVKYKKQKWPGASLREVKEIITTYASINEKFSDVKCRKIAKDIYYISHNKHS